MKHFGLLLSLVLTMGLPQFSSAHVVSGYLSGQATIGENPTLFSGNLIIGSSGELFLGSDDTRLQKTYRIFHIGDYVGEAGARVHLSVTNNSNTHGSRGFLDIVGTATGRTEIVLDMFHGWDGSPIDVARAHLKDSDENAFFMEECYYNGRRAQLRSRIESNDRVWFIAELPPITACLPIILQKQNNTLVVDNNPTSNGGYTFSYYKWYRNDVLVHEGGWGSGLGGVYNVGRGQTLNTFDTYHVIVIDQDGEEHFSCPYNPTIFNPEPRIIAYPNPTTIDQSLVVVDVETDDEELLKNGVITVYQILGRTFGETRTNGHRITPIQLPAVVGTYLLRFVSGDYQTTLRVIIQ